MMCEMTPRERLLTVLSGGIPDRVPVAPFVQEEYLNVAYPEKDTVDRVVDATALAEELDFDLMAKHRTFETPHFLKKSFPNWEVRQQTRRTDGILIKRLEIVTPDRTMCHEESAPDIKGAAAAGIHSCVTKHLLEEDEDIETFIKFLPDLDEESIAEMHKTAKQWSEVIGDRGVLAPWGWCGAFNMTCDLRGIETLMLDPYDDEGLYEALMDRMTGLMEDYCGTLASTAVDCVGMQGHMANSRTIGTDYYRKYILPYEKRVVDAIHQGGAYSVFHNCGYASTFYDIYRDMGMSVWETISEPPQGDNDLSKVKAELGSDITLLGNLDQIDFLKRATKIEIEEETRRIMEIGKPGGRYIFSNSDFLERGTPRENIVAMIEAAKTAGEY